MELIVPTPEDFRSATTSTCLRYYSPFCPDNDALNSGTVNICGNLSASNIGIVNQEGKKVGCSLVLMI